MARPQDAADEARQQSRDTRIPLGRRGRAYEAAATIAFLLTPLAGYITAQEIHVGGGLDQTVLPGPYSA